jgi:hypothetical protein
MRREKSVRLRSQLEGREHRSGMKIGETDREPRSPDNSPWSCTACWWTGRAFSPTKRPQP